MRWRGEAREMGSAAARVTTSFMRLKYFEVFYASTKI